MSCAWKEQKCRIGLIIGTGTNACYLEDIDSIHTLEKQPGLLTLDLKNERQPNIPDFLCQGSDNYSLC